MIDSVGGMGGMDHSQMMQKRFAMDDKNNSGGLDLEEFGAIKPNEGMTVDQVAEAFGAADTDNNGSLTQDEMKAAHEKMGGRPPMPPRGNNDEFLSNLKSAIKSDDQDTINSLIESFSKNIGAYGNENQINLTSMLFDTEA